MHGAFFYYNNYSKHLVRQVCQLVCQNAVTVCQVMPSYRNRKKPKSQDMQSFDKICHAYHLFPNDEATRRQLNPRSLMLQGFSDFRHPAKYATYANVCAKSYAKTHEKSIKLSSYEIYRVSLFFISKNISPKRLYGVIWSPYSNLLC